MRALVSVAILTLACDPAAAQLPDLFALESYTVEYEVTGAQTGTRIVHSRDHGRLGALIDRTSAAKRIVTAGTEATVYNLDARTGLRTVNTQLQQLLPRLQPGTYTELMLEAGGFTPTTDLRTIAGETCRVWSRGMVASFCVTDDDLILERTYPSVGVTERATAVRRGDGGPDAAFAPEPGIEIVQLGPPQ